MQQKENSKITIILSANIYGHHPLAFYVCIFHDCNFRSLFCANKFNLNADRALRKNNKTPNKQLLSQIRNVDISVLNTLLAPGNKMILRFQSATTSGNGNRA